MAKKIFEFIRGDTFDEPIVVKDKLKRVIDVTGWKFYFTLRRQVTNENTDTNVIYTTSWTESAGVSGTRLTIVKETTTAWTPGEYVCDVQYKKPDGSVKTIKGGSTPAIIYGDVTRGFA